MFELLESLEPDHEREAKEERLEGLDKQTVASLNIIGVGEKPAAEVLVRRRIEAIVFEQCEEFTYLSAPAKPSPSPQKFAEPEEVDGPPVKAIAEATVIMESNLESVIVVSVQQSESVSLMEDRQAQTGLENPPVERSQEPRLTKRRPTRVPHSPLLQLRRITKLIKKK